MTDQPKTALAQFMDLARRIDAIADEVKAARTAPARHANIAERTVIHSSSWSVPESQRLAEQAAQAIKATVVDRFRATGERERDAKLCALAAELTAIRSALPNLAVRAAIELGATSRALFAEAQEGSAA